MYPCELRLCLSLVGFCVQLCMGALGEFIVIFELIRDCLQFFEKNVGLFSTSNTLCEYERMLVHFF